MKLFNTLSNEKEEFVSIEPGKVSLYTCGPTVYDSVHVGNLRAYVFNDLLKRTLAANGYEVNHVMNITDVDDKTIKRSGGNKNELKELTKKYEDKFLADFDALNNIRPTLFTRATQYVEEMINFIDDLIEKGFAYKASDGSVYFSIAKFADYGKLARMELQDLKAGARVAQDEYEKENPADFVLWKAWDEKDGEISWKSPFGKGRPGWHIECSVMATDALGATIDIHAGGIDLVFPHHTNEIAQSEAKTGQKFVNFWVHNEHLLVEGKKMSKSLANFYTLDDIKEKGFSPLDFRYLCLQSHYRSKLNFTWEAMTAAKNARERLINIYGEGKDLSGQVDQKYLSQFLEKISDDLDTPSTFAVMWEMLRDSDLNAADKSATLKKMDELVLALNIAETLEVPAEIIEIAERRRTARENKDFAASDKFRAEIEAKGYKIEDRPDNTYEIKKY